MSDTDNLVRLIILAGLGKVPVGGELISGLVGVFWPESGADVWDSIRADVEALINQQIATEVSLMSAPSCRDCTTSSTITLRPSGTQPAT